MSAAEREVSIGFLILRWRGIRSFRSSGESLPQRWTAVAFACALVLGVLQLSAPALAEPAADDLATDLARLDEQILEAGADVERYDGGALRILAALRLQTLLLTEALLEQRLMALRNGIPVEAMLPTLQSDPAAAAEIAQRLVAARSQLEQARIEAETTRGLVGTVATVEFYTRSLEVAQLELSLSQALYGLRLPEVDTAAPETTFDELRSVPEASEEAEPEDATVLWADPRHPNIDYGDMVFQVYHEAGYRLAGWWGVNIRRAAIDDSPVVTSINLTREIERSSGSLPAPDEGLWVRCREGEVAVFYRTSAFRLFDHRATTVNVIERRDREDAAAGTWSTTVKQDTAGLFGTRAIEFLGSLLDREQLFLRVTDTDGINRDAIFKLAGVEDVFEETAVACGFPPLSRQEMKALQAALAAAGFDPGPVDGMWGRRTDAALASWAADSGATLQEPYTRAQLLKVFGDL